MPVLSKGGLGVSCAIKFKLSPVCSSLPLFSLSFLQIEEDAYQEDLGFSLGHLGKSGSGRVRQTQVNEATKARISKTLQVRNGRFLSRQSARSTHSICWVIGSKANY